MSSPGLLVLLLVVLSAVLMAPGRPTSPMPSRRRGGPRTVAPGGEPSTADVGESARLLAAALRSGIGTVEALDVVAALGPPAARPDLRVVVAAARWGLAPDRCWEQVDDRWSPIGAALVAADEAGLSPVRALEAAADQLDRDRRARVQTAVRRVEVLVVLPLGLAFLPGFVLAAVVPLVVGLASGLAGP